MGKYIKNFETHGEYVTYSETYLKNKNEYRPNVSYCKDQLEIHYNGQIESIIKATFNVLNSSDIVKLTDNTTNISEMYIDGTKQDSIVSSYTFSTSGEHEVKYTLQDISYLSSSLCYLCSDLTSINIPDSVTAIGAHAFEGCTGLTSVNIPNGVIGYMAFMNCTNLTYVYVGENVKLINTSAFEGCRSLNSFVCLPIEPPQNKGCFWNLLLNFNIYVPDESVNNYKSAWSEYADRIKPLSEKPNESV